MTVQIAHRLKLFCLSLNRSSHLKLNLSNNLIVSKLIPSFNVPCAGVASPVATLMLLPFNSNAAHFNLNNGSTASTTQNPRLYQQLALRVKPLKQKTVWFFWKFKYSGKGLKIKKANKQQQVLFNLGSSHISKMLFDPSLARILRTRKNTYTLLSYKPYQPVTPALMARIRPFNKYTKRGLRLSRQPLARRFGKVSQLGAKKR